MQVVLYKMLIQQRVQEDGGLAAAGKIFSPTEVEIQCYLVMGDVRDCTVWGHSLQHISHDEVRPQACQPAGCAPIADQRPSIPPTLPQQKPPCCPTRHQVDVCQRAARGWTNYHISPSTIPQGIMLLSATKGQLPESMHAYYLSGWSVLSLCSWGLRVWGMQFLAVQVSTQPLA